MGILSTLISLRGGSESLQVQYRSIVASILTYWAVSLTMTFLNKHLLSESELIDTPLFITWFQSLVTVLLILLLRCFSIRHPTKLNFPELNVNKNTMLELVPLTYTFMGTITLTNTCLTYMEISTWSFLRLASVFWALFIPYFILGTKVSAKAAMCCFVLVFGYTIGILAEKDLGSLSWKGVFFGVLSSLFVALQTTYTKKMLPLVDNCVWRLMFYNNLNSAVFIIPLIFVSGEHLNLVESWLDEPFLWIQMLTSGILGLGMSYCYAWMIQVTSPLTCNVAGSTKMMIQTLLAVVIYDEEKSGMWWIANLVVTISTLGYSYVKDKEMRAQALQA